MSALPEHFNVPDGLRFVHATAQPFVPRARPAGEVAQHDHGLATFKAKWGGQPQPLHRYYLPPPPPESVTSEESTGRLHRMAEGAWRRLPPGMTAVLGDRLYGYL